jgi:hypothetical protein
MANPVVTTLHTQIEAGTSKYGDLSQMTALVNRSFRRQGLQWAVSGFTLISQPTASGSVRIQKLPDTWIMANAWVKGFKIWQKLNLEAASETDSILPKFHDYKVFMDFDHAFAGTDLNLLPVGTDANVAFERGDWDYSKMVIPDNSNPGFSSEREIICVGKNFPGTGASGLNSVSLIEGYAASRALPDILDPNTPADAADADGLTPENWIQAVLNEGVNQDAVVLDNLRDENIQAPYPFENDGNFTDTMYPNGANQPPVPSGEGCLELHDLVDIQSGNTVGNRTYMRGGTFQCGLFKIDNNTDQSLEVLIHLVPGRSKSGRGYLTLPMQDVN